MIRLIVSDLDGTLMHNDRSIANRFFEQYHELKRRGIGVTTVYPFWTATEFFDRAIDPNTEPVVKSYAAMYEPEQIVARAWRDAKRGKEVCRYGFIARSQSFLAKLLPHNLIMKVWMSQQKLK